MTVSEAYSALYLAALVLLGVGMLFALIRAVKGPRIADRLMGINMFCTMTIIAIAVLAMYLSEAWLIDVALVYCMIGFAAIVVLAKVYISRYAELRSEEEGERDE